MSGKEQSSISRILRDLRKRTVTTIFTTQTEADSDDE